MFLYLSKLLPLFIYPLGLACVLLVLAMLSLWWKRPGWTAGCIALALALLLLGGNGWVATRLTRSLEWQNLPPENLPTAEAIVVLGGATKPKIPPRPWVDVMESGDRILHGARLYQQGKAPLVIMSGGRIYWKGGGPPESSDMAELAMALGVPRSVILEDTTSLNTYENAVNVKAILEQQGINRVLLVTSAMHMPRSLKIFQKQGIEAIPAPTDFLVAQQDLEEVGNSLEAVLLNLLPDADRMQQTSRALKEYIGLVIYRLRGWL
ncbi:YdcF family protein [Leptolyngbya sp. AN02str]|uniref:YdcF family protein n=1 Tax=Leptolyngbya sp. AN02str TaxID=3423363 RepID=UPI003D313F6D